MASPGAARPAKRTAMAQKLIAPAGGGDGPSPPEKIQVAIRVRPLNSREIGKGQGTSWRTDDNMLTVCNDSGRPVSHGSYTFDHIYNASSKTLHIYDGVAKHVVTSAMEGFNGTIFAYGQTSTGKTHTMMGLKSEPGIIPSAVRDVFDYIEQNPEREFLLRVSYMEIYNENITDLLTKKTNLKVRENLSEEVYVGDLSEEMVTTPDDIMTLMARGEASRKVGETKMNDKSSRSHSIFKMIIESRARDAEGTAGAGDTDEATQSFIGCDSQSVRVAHLNLVDLAGSERASNTQAQGIRLKEGSHINKSLLALGSVIGKLSEGGKGSHIPYRDSQLTRVLQSSLGGNARTVIICTVTLSSLHVEETTSTLKFASRAKKIKNSVSMNEMVTDEAMLVQYQREISELKQRLDGLSGDSEAHDKVTTLNGEKDRLESDMERQQQEINRLKRLIIVSSVINRTEPTGPDRGRRVANRKKERRETWAPSELTKSLRSAMNEGLDDVDDANAITPTPTPTTTTTETDMASFYPERISYLEAKVTMLQQKIDEQDAELSTTQSMLLERTASETSLVERCGTMMADLEQAHTDVVSARTMRDALETDHVALEDAVVQAKVAHEKEIDAIKEIMREKESQFAASRQELKELGEAMEKARFSMENMEEDNEDLLATIEEMNEKSTQHKTTIEEMKEEAKERETTIKAMEDEAKQREEVLEAMNEETKQSEETHAASRGKQEALQTQLHAAESQVETLSAEVSRLTRDLDCVKQEMATAAEAADVVSTEHATALTVAHTREAALSEAHQRLQERLDELECAVAADAEAATAEATASTDALRQEVERVSTALREQQQHCDGDQAKHEAALAEVRQALADAHATRDQATAELQATRARLDSEVEEQSDRVQDLQEAVAELEENLLAEEAERGEMENSFNAAELRVEALEKQVGDNELQAQAQARHVMNLEEQMREQGVRLDKAYNELDQAVFEHEKIKVAMLASSSNDKTALAEVRIECDQAQKQACDAEAALTVLQQESATDITRLEDCLKKVEWDLEVARATPRGDDEATSKWRAEADELRTANAALEAAQQTLAQEHESGVALLRSQLADVVEEVAASNALVAKANQNLEEHQQRLRTAQGDLEDAQAMVVRLEGERSEQAAAMEGHRATAAALQDMHLSEAGTKAELVEIADLLVMAQADQQALSHKVTELEGLLVEAHQGGDVWQHQVTSLEEANEALAGQVTEAKAEVERCRDAHAGRVAELSAENERLLDDAVSAGRLRTELEQSTALARNLAGAAEARDAFRCERDDLARQVTVLTDAQAEAKVEATGTATRLSTLQATLEEALEAVSSEQAAQATLAERVAELTTAVQEQETAQAGLKTAAEANEAAYAAHVGKLEAEMEVARGRLKAAEAFEDVAQRLTYAQEDVENGQRQAARQQDVVEEMQSTLQKIANELDEVSSERSQLEHALGVKQSELADARVTRGAAEKAVLAADATTRAASAKAAELAEQASEATRSLERVTREAEAARKSHVTKVEVMQEDYHQRMRVQRDHGQDTIDRLQRQVDQLSGKTLSLERDLEGQRVQATRQADVAERLGRDKHQAEARLQTAADMVEAINQTLERNGMVSGGDVLEKLAEFISKTRSSEAQNHGSKNGTIKELQEKLKAAQDDNWVMEEDNAREIERLHLIICEMQDKLEIVEKEDAAGSGAAGSGRSTAVAAEMGHLRDAAKEAAAEAERHMEALSVKSSELALAKSRLLEQTEELEQLGVMRRTYSNVIEQRGAAAKRIETLETQTRALEEQNKALAAAVQRRDRDREGPAATDTFPALAMANAKPSVGAAPTTGTTTVKSALALKSSLASSHPKQKPSGHGRGVVFTAEVIARDEVTKNAAQATTKDGVMASAAEGLAKDDLSSSKKPLGESNCQASGPTGVAKPARKRMIEQLVQDVETQEGKTGSIADKGECNQM